MSRPSITLASASLRRKFLLEQVGFVVTTASPNVDESRLPGEPPAEMAMRLSIKKAQAIGKKGIIVAGDTVVALASEVFGKPQNDAHARQMLRRLSGVRHQVFSGYCVMREDVNKSGVVATDVLFRDLTDDEIDRYIASGETHDKAGAYAIQGLGSFLIKEVHGSFTNVIGLPLPEVIDAIEQLA